MYGDFHPPASCKFDPFLCPGTNPMNQLEQELHQAIRNFCPMLKAKSSEIGVRAYRCTLWGQCGGLGTDPDPLAGSPEGGEVISIQEGKVLPSMLLRKLTNSRKNRLYQA